MSCSSLTSKSFARANGGKCKACVTGVAPASREPRGKRGQCGECGASVKMSYESPYQEYPGASVQGGYWYYQCKCGHSDIQKDLGGYRIIENTRGW